MDKLLSAAERLSQVGPINALVDRIANSVAPKTTAKACGGCLLYCGPGGPNGRLAVYGTLITIPGGRVVCGGPNCYDYTPTC